MDEDLTITRDVELDLDADELWALVGDGDGWAQWMADASDVEVAPGGSGEVTDGGVRRAVRVDEVGPGRRVAYRWWPADEPDAVSRVELVVLPRPDGSTLHIAETCRAAAALRTVASVRWEVRSLVLWSRCCARSRA